MNETFSVQDGQGLPGGQFWFNLFATYMRASRHLTGLSIDGQFEGLLLALQKPLLTTEPTAMAL